eukprot:NODE_131_length_16689_cov_0.437914.p7 type:complete len:200 gc:universal NODE_131_length_16689_cov_0.437914:2392-1793(-)
MMLIQSMAALTTTKPLCGWQNNNQLCTGNNEYCNSLGQCDTDPKGKYACQPDYSATNTCEWPKNPNLSVDGKCGFISSGNHRYCPQTYPYCVKSKGNSDFAFQGTCEKETSYKSKCDSRFSAYPACPRLPCGVFQVGASIETKQCDSLAPYCEMDPFAEKGYCFRFKNGKHCHPDFSYGQCDGHPIQTNMNPLVNDEVF